MAKTKYQYALPDHLVETMKIELDKLTVDERAQRNLTIPRVEAMTRNWMPTAAGTIVVSRRMVDGVEKFFVVDGQCRAEAARRNGEKTISADVHFGLTQQEEAVLFLIKNREASKVSSLDEYQVGLTAGLSLFTDTQAILDKHGLTVGSTSTNSVGAVAGLLQITEAYGPGVLDRTLTVAEETYGRTDKTWDGIVISGIGRFLGKHGLEVDDKTLVTKLARKGNVYSFIGTVITMSTLGGTQNAGGGGRAGAAYKLVLDAWNTKRKVENRLEAA